MELIQNQKNPVFVRNIAYDFRAKVLLQSDSTDAYQSFAASTANIYKNYVRQGASVRKNCFKESHYIPKSDCIIQNRYNRCSCKMIEMAKTKTAHRSRQWFLHWFHAYSNNGFLKPRVLSHILSLEAIAAQFSSTEKTSKFTNSSGISVIGFTSSVF